MAILGKVWNMLLDPSLGDYVISLADWDEPYEQQTGAPFWAREIFWSVDSWKLTNHRVLLVGIRFNRALVPNPETTPRSMRRFQHAPPPPQWKRHSTAPQQRKIRQRQDLRQFASVPKRSGNWHASDSQKNCAPLTDSVPCWGSNTKADLLQTRRCNKKTTSHILKRSLTAA